jgi:hypothetical protein
MVINGGGACDTTQALGCITEVVIQPKAWVVSQGLKLYEALLD